MLWTARPSAYSWCATSDLFEAQDCTLPCIALGRRPYCLCGITDEQHMV